MWHVQFFIFKLRYFNYWAFILVLDFISQFWLFLIQLWLDDCKISYASDIMLNDSEYL